MRLVRADSGFCQAEWLDLLESQRLAYIVVAKLLHCYTRANFDLLAVAECHERQVFAFELQQHEIVLRIEQSHRPS